MIQFVGFCTGTSGVASETALCRKRLGIIPYFPGRMRVLPYSQRVTPGMTYFSIALFCGSNNSRTTSNRVYIGSCLPECLYLCFGSTVGAIHTNVATGTSARKQTLANGCDATWPKLDSAAQIQVVAARLSRRVPRTLQRQFITQPSAESPARTNATSRSECHRSSASRGQRSLCTRP